jgi:sec-independent protein translocase protein TatC
MTEAEATPEQVENAGVEGMPLLEHLKELRDRLIRAAIALGITTAVSFIFAKALLIILIEPMGDTAPQALKPTESIANYMKVALISGVTLAMPFIVYQIGKFLTPGLTKSERRWLWILVPGATLCFITGVAFAYFIMLPAAIPFLQGFMADIVLQQWALGEYLSFVINLMFWIGLAFELPLFVFILAKLGIVDAEMLTKNRKYAVVVIAVLSAIITPTVDPMNMVLVMGPLIILYEIGVILAKIA